MRNIFFGLGFALLVIVTEQVQQTMQQQVRKLLTNLQFVLKGLLFYLRNTQNNVSQKGAFPQKTEHIRDFVFFAKLFIESDHIFFVHQNHTHLLFKIQAMPRCLAEVSSDDAQQPF